MHLWWSGVASKQRYPCWSFPIICLLIAQGVQPMILHAPDSSPPKQDARYSRTPQPNPLKEKWNPVNKSSKQCFVGKIFGICNEGAEKELAGDPRTLAIGCDRQWVSWDSDHEAQQRYNRLQKQSWIAYHLGRGQEWWVGKLDLLEDAGKVAGVPSSGTDSGVCSFPVQHSRDSSHSTSRCMSEASARQMGQVRLVFNHLSTHLAWNSWLQGNTRSSCLHSKSLKHTTHSVCSDRWFSELNL